MNDHLSDEALYAHAERGETDADASVRAHLTGCAPCRTRHARLRAGASLMALARADKAPDVAWSAIDAKVFAAAESAASDIRRGRLRPARGLTTSLAAGLTLAAAAAGIFALRVAGQGHEPVAIAPPPPSQPARPLAARNVTAPEQVATVGVVLMVAAPVDYVAPDGSTHALEMTTEVREGGRIRAREGGRAVVAMHTGARLDARAGADVRLTRFARTDVTLELSKGEARVDGAGAAGQRTTLVASGWTVEAKGGAFVAKMENNVVRLRVVSGKVGVSQNGGGAREANAGDEVELAKDSAGYQVVSHVARDAGEMDQSFLAEDGRVFALPALPGMTSVRVGERGVLPGSVRGIRASGPVALSADVNGETYTLELGPASPAPTAWARVARGSVASSAATVRPGVSGAVAQARVVRPGGTVSGEATTVVPPAAETPAPAQEQVVAAAEPEAPAEVESAGDREADRAAASRALSVRSAGCFRECEAAGGCGEDVSGYVALDTEDDGRVSAVRAHGFSSASLAACVEREARGLRMPRTLRAQHVQLDVARR